MPPGAIQVRFVIRVLGKYRLISTLPQIVSSILAAYAVQVTKRKGPVLFGLTLFPLAGAGALYALPRGAEHKHQLLGAYYVLSICM